MGVIYKITCNINGKSYIGQTKHNSRYRWNQHLWEVRHPEANQSRKLNNAIIKYGPENFTIEDLWTDDDENLDFWEINYIDEYDTFNNGYNLTKGGKANQVVSEETRKKLSDKLKGKPKNVKDNRKREEDWNLPKYIKCYRDSTGREGYKVEDHPMLKGKSVSFTASNLTMEVKFANALAILESLNKGTYVHTKPDLPKGIQLIKNGYRVRVKNHPVKTFQDSTLTMEEKLDLATMYNNAIKIGIQFND